MVVDDLGKLVSQLAGEGDLVGLPFARRAGLFQAQHADHLAIDTNTGIEHRPGFSRIQAFGHFAGARVSLDIAGVDRPAGIQRLQVGGVGADIHRRA